MISSNKYNQVCQLFTQAGGYLVKKQRFTVLNTDFTLFLSF